MTIHFVFSFVYSYFNSLTVSTFFLSTRVRQQVAHLTFIDTLTISNFSLIKNQIKLSFVKKLSITSLNQSFPWFLCLIEYTSLLTILLMIVRVLFLLVFQNINKFYVSLLGSIFELVGANRIHSELAVLHYSIFALSTIILIFLKSDSSSFFQIIIIFCNQFLNSNKTNTSNSSKLNHLYATNSHALYLLPEKNAQTLARFGKFYLCFQPFICVSMAINVALTATMIFFISNPEKNNVNEFASMTFYWIYSIGVIFMWSSWTFWVSFNIYYIFVYYLFCSKILHFKHRTEYINLFKLAKDFKQMHRVGNTYISAILMTHLIREDQIFNEIRLLNRFWSIYLSYTNIICSSLFCYTLYISSMTNAMWFMKLFFITVSFPPIGMLVVGTWFAARLYETPMKMYHCHSMLLCLYSSINFRVQLKVLNTLNLICSHCVGYTFVTGTTIKNETIYQALISTMMLFFLIANVTKA